MAINYGKGKNDLDYDLTNARKVQCKMCCYENKQYAGGGIKRLRRKRSMCYFCHTKLFAVTPFVRCSSMTVVLL